MSTTDTATCNRDSDAFGARSCHFSLLVHRSWGETDAHTYASDTSRELAAELYERMGHTVTRSETHGGLCPLAAR